MLFPMINRTPNILAAALLLSASMHDSFAIEPLASQEFMEKIQQDVQNCSDLWKQIRESDCGNRMIGILEGGYIELGLSTYSLDMNLSNDKTRAMFDGEPHFAPLYSINTGLRFLDESEFGYGVKFSYQQAYALHQTISRSGKNVTENLGTYAISDTLSTELSFYYVNGIKDLTPDIYFAFGIGFGAGYGNVVGKAYMTENMSADNPACHQAGTNLVNDVSGAAQAIKQSCTLESYHRFGLGFSGQLSMDFRYKSVLVGLSTRVIQMSADNLLAFGSKKYNLNPATNSITVAYLFDL